MRVLTLMRKYHPTGTNGQLFVGTQLICDTIELPRRSTPLHSEWMSGSRPWRQNQRNVSCIPEGRYMLSLRWTSRWGWHFQIPHVPERDWILIHPANDALKELRGCIAPVTKVTGPGSGTGSRKALQRLLDEVQPVLQSGMPVQLIIHS